MQVLLVDPPEHALPDGTSDLVRESGWTIAPVADYRSAIRLTHRGSIDAVILTEPDGPDTDEEQNREFQHLIRLIDARRIAAVMVTDHPRHRATNPRSLIDFVDSQVSLAELRGRLAMMEKYHRLVQELERELGNMERLSKQLNQHFQEVDEEMRLAARLQRDFLPQLDEPIRGIRFASIFRPASWVSGDMFDVFRIDEDTTGFYIADAVGHGMAASLLTMFIKRSIVSKRVASDGYTVLSPSEAMVILNDALTEQSLPNCQFVTACYGLIDHPSLTLRYARGGHPYPILITPDGLTSELRTPGGLLGIFKESEFPTYETRLSPGDKVLLYTDGLETAIAPDAHAQHDPPLYEQTFGSLAHLPVGAMLQQLESCLDRGGENQSVRDDVTIVGLEVLDS